MQTLLLIPTKLPSRSIRYSNNPLFIIKITTKSISNSVSQICKILYNRVVYKRECLINSIMSYSKLIANSMITHFDLKNKQ